jgi:hypothetical protein
MTQLHTIDWYRLLWDLIQRGHSIADVSKQAGIAESTVKGYLRGSHPPHWRGEVLIELWCLSCRKGRDDLPRTELVIAPRVVNRSTGPGFNNESIRELERAWR